MPIYKHLVVVCTGVDLAVSFPLALASLWRELDQELIGGEAGCNLWLADRLCFMIGNPRVVQLPVKKDVAVPCQ